MRFVVRAAKALAYGIFGLLVALGLWALVLKAPEEVQLRLIEKLTLTPR